LEQKSQGISRNIIGITYIAGSVVLESAAIDLNDVIKKNNSSALEVAFPPRREFDRKLQLVIFPAIAQIELKGSANES
jgi:hypothetical protein